MRQMTSMKITAEDREGDLKSMPSIYEMPQDEFPYGLRLTLSSKEMDKLGIDEGEAFIGGMIHLHAMARIVSISSNNGRGGKSCCIELQIEDLCLESEDEENDEN